MDSTTRWLVLALVVLGLVDCLMQTGITASRFSGATLGSWEQGRDQSTSHAMKLACRWRSILIQIKRTGRGSGIGCCIIA